MLKGHRIKLGASEDNVPKIQSRMNHRMKSVGQTQAGLVSMVHHEIQTKTVGQHELQKNSVGRNRTSQLTRKRSNVMTYPI